MLTHQGHTLNTYGPPHATANTFSHTT